MVSQGDENLAGEVDISSFLGISMVQLASDSEAVKMELTCKAQGELMARHKKLDKTVLLDAAEMLVRERGSHALSLANVAEVANVSKGGIQSNFGTRDNLINALLERWEGTLQNAVVTIRDQSGPSVSEVDIQILASRLAYDQNPEHHKAMMILVTQSDELRSRSRDWFQDKLSKIEKNMLASRHDKLKLLLNDAMFVIQALDFTSLSEQEWKYMLEDLDAKLEH